MSGENILCHDACLSELMTVALANIPKGNSL
jgi:hypothetical protein